MTVWHPDLQDSAASTQFPAFAHALSGWFLHGQIEGWSEQTLRDRQHWAARVQKYLQDTGQNFDANGLRAFLAAFSMGDPATGCRKKPRPASIRHVIAIMKAFCSWCVAEGLMATNPAQRLPLPIDREDTIQPFDEQEILRLIAAAKNTRDAPRDTAILALLLDAGLRASELAGLLMSDLNLSSRTIVVRRGKGGRTRTVSFGVTCTQALWQYLRRNPREPNDWLFETVRGEPFTKDSLGKLFDRLGKAANVPRCHPHRARHTCATNLLRNSANLFEVMAQLGHSRPSTTQIYVKVSERDLQAMQARSSPLDGFRKRSK